MLTFYLKVKIFIPYLFSPHFLFHPSMLPVHLLSTLDSGPISHFSFSQGHNKNKKI